jgi:choline dehydrogenase
MRPRNSTEHHHEQPFPVTNPAVEGKFIRQIPRRRGALIRDLKIQGLAQPLLYGTEHSMTLTRRKFLKNSVDISAGAVAITAAGSLGSALLSQSIRSAFSAGENEFDYVIVGTGAGGGPLACNLVRAGYSVCLLEAGGDYHGQKYEVPAFHGLSTETPEISWEFYVKHYTHRPERDSKYQNQPRGARGPKREGILYPRAATIGGCTAHNAMVTLYPDNEDWNQIAELTGDRSWQAEGMRRYFQRVENNHYVRRTKMDEYLGLEKRGYHGWLQTEQTNPLIALKDQKVLNVLLAALEEEGVASEMIEKLFQGGNVLLDPNSWSYVKNKTDGLFNIPRATRNGKRNGTREYILDTYRRHKERFSVRTHSLASRILFSENESKRAIGIEYLKGAHLYEADPNSSLSQPNVRSTERVYARREVILSGGAFNSPQLLMLSGIGDAKELEAQKIPVRVHRPGVGKNLQDRYEVGVVSELKNPLALLEGCTFGEPNDPCLEDYKRDGKDSVYATNGVLISFIRRSRKEKSSPDLCIFGLPGNFRGYHPGWSKEALKPSTFTWAILKGHTKNTAGTVGLKSANPMETPNIHFKYFEEGNDRSGDDLKSVVEALKFVRKVNQRPLIASNVKEEALPGRNSRSNEDLAEFVMNEAWGHHASCSNKMGPANDPMAVVDSQFRVHGVKNLRVVDASVFPKIPGLFIVAPTYMIAEKASEVILAEADRKRFVTFKP